MRRYNPPYYGPPRRGYGGRRWSPPRRGNGRGKEHSHGSLLVRNIPLDCRPEELQVPFERFGRVRDVYLPKDYYTGQPRGFAFVEFVDPYDAAEAQHHMNRQIFGGREISVVLVAESRKRPEEMHRRSRVGGSSGYGDQRSHYGRSRSRSVSRSRSSCYHSGSPSYRRPRSYSLSPRRRADYSVSPNRRHADHSTSPRESPKERDNGHCCSHILQAMGMVLNSLTMAMGVMRGAFWVHLHSLSMHFSKAAYDSDERHVPRGPSHGRLSGSPSGSGSRYRSADISPRGGR